jgi:hypothetical protein
MAAQLFYLPFPTAFNSNGLAVPGAKLEFYLSGTSTPTPSYTTSALTVENAWPVVANGAGRFVSVYLDDALTYRLVIKNAAGSTLDDVDPYTPGTIIGSGPRGLPGSGNVIGFTPEDFGAVGDGATNDTDAFIALSDAINDAGSCVVDLTPGATYLVGKQSLAGTSYNADMGVSSWYLKPHPILFLNNCDGVTIRFNGAKLKCVAGLKFGGFNPTTGVALGSITVDPTKVASPFGWMIYVANSTNVSISGGTIDGNLAHYVAGGQYGDTGWQIACHAIEVNTCRQVTISDMILTDCGTDGLVIASPGLDDASPDSAIAVTRVRSEYNGRNNCSLVGGKGIAFRDCSFNYSGGRGGIISNPSAGFDVEAESALVRKIRFDNCEFSTNYNAGLVADSGDGADIEINTCRFIGSLNVAAWLKKPGIKVYNSIFMGATFQVYGDTDPAQAAHFYECTFTDDTDLSPVGTSYNDGAGNPILQFAAGGNQYFERCTFRSINNSRVPNSDSVTTRYHDCIFDQQTATAGSLVGTFTGNLTNFVSLNIGFGASIFLDDFKRGGTLYRKEVFGQTTWNPPSIAAGASTSTTVSLPGVTVGYQPYLADVNYGSSIHPLISQAYVSATDTVTLVLSNPSSGAIDLGSLTVTYKARRLG